MGLRAEAEELLSEMMEDVDLTGWPITITDPDSLSGSMVGISADISQIIDPDTGAVISGRSASVALRISSLTSLGFTSLPDGIVDETSKPWIVVFDDINGTSYTFKVMESNPDRGAGIVTCLLELYTP